MNLLVFIKFHRSYLITNEVCVMSSKILGIKASSYVRFQAGIDWFNMLQGATRILRVKQLLTRKKMNRNGYLKILKPVSQLN